MGKRRLYLKEGKKTILLAGPVIGSQLAQMSMGFVDTVMVGRLGPEALAGVALGNTLFFFLLIVCMGVINAVAPLVSQAYGANEHDPVERSVRQGMVVGFLLAIPCSLIIWNIGSVLLAMGQEPGTVFLSQGYLRAIVWGFLPFLFFGALRGMVEGISRPLPVTIITVLGLSLNVLANYVLMFGKWGFPELGVIGTGWASAIVYWFMFSSLLIITRSVNPFKSYKVIKYSGWIDLRYLKEVVRIGWPIGISHGVESGLFSVTALLIGLLGTASLAAHQIAIQCAAYTFMVPMGIGIAASVRVGQETGRKDPEAAQRAGFIAIGLATLFMAITAVLFWTIPNRIIGIYIDTQNPQNTEVVQIAVVLLSVAAVFQVFDGVQVASAGALRGLKDTKIPMVINVISYWVVGLGGGLLIGFQLDRGAVGLWWGLVVGLAAAAFLLSWRFRRTTVRHIRNQSAETHPSMVKSYPHVGRSSTSLDGS